MFANSHNYEKLKHAWVEWRKVSGAKYRHQYLEFIQLKNEEAESLGMYSIIKVLQYFYAKKNLKEYKWQTLYFFI